VVACPQTGIITGERLTGAAGQDNSDAAVAARFLADQAADDGPACEWYGDSAYGTGDLRAAIGQAGHRAVIKPGPLKPAVEGGFTADDFAVGENVGTVTCPAGSPGLSAPTAMPPSVPPAAPARCATGALPPKTGAACTCTLVMRSCVLPGPVGPPSPPSARTTRNTAPTSNG